MASDTPRAEFTEIMERQLDEIRTRFQELELEQMKKGEIEARAKLADAKKRFERKRMELEDKLDTVRRASAGAWEEARDGADAAWDQLVQAMDRARADFQGTLQEEKESADGGG